MDNFQNLKCTTKHFTHADNSCLYLWQQLQLATSGFVPRTLVNTQFYISGNCNQTNAIAHICWTMNFCRLISLFEPIISLFFWQHIHPLNGMDNRRLLNTNSKNSKDCKWRCPTILKKPSNYHQYQFNHNSCSFDYYKFRLFFNATQNENDWNSKY